MLREGRMKIVLGYYVRKLLIRAAKKKRGEEKVTFFVDPIFWDK